MSKPDLDEIRARLARARARREEIRQRHEAFDREFECRFKVSPGALRRVNGIDTGDVILCRAPGSLANRLGQGLLRGTLRPSPFSHAAICVNGSFVIDAVPRKKLWPRPVAGWLSRYDPDLSVVLRPPRDRLPSKAEVFAAILRKAGREYDLLRIFGLRVGPKSRAFFCSEYVADVFRPYFADSILGHRYLPVDLHALLKRCGFVEVSLREALDPASTTLPDLQPPHWGERHPLDTDGSLTLATFEEMVQHGAAIADVRAWTLRARMTAHMQGRSLRTMAGEEVHLTSAFEVAELLPDLAGALGESRASGLDMTLEPIDDLGIGPEQVDRFARQTLDELATAADRLAAFTTDLLRLVDGSESLSDENIRAIFIRLESMVPIISVARRARLDGRLEAMQRRSAAIGVEIPPPLDRAPPLIAAIVRVVTLIGVIFTADPPDPAGPASAARDGSSAAPLVAALSDPARVAEIRIVAALLARVLQPRDT